MGAWVRNGVEYTSGHILLKAGHGHAVHLEASQALRVTQSNNDLKLRQLFLSLHQPSLVKLPHH